MATFLVVCTFLTTLSLVSLGVSIYLNRVSQVKAKEAVTLAGDMRVAYNAQTETLATIVARLADLETSLRMRTK
jgi:hypothetical protein